MRNKLAVLLVFVILGGVAANAQITVTLDGGYPIQTPGYTPGYSEYLYTVSTDAADHLSAGNSFTISGISGLFNAVAPTNFTATDNISGGTVTFTYTGPTTATSFSEDGFDINTSPGYTGIGTGSFSGTATSSGGGTVSASGTVSVPTFATTATPEPSSLMLLSTGILGAAGMVRRRLGGK